MIIFMEFFSLNIYWFYGYYTIHIFYPFNINMITYRVNIIFISSMELEFIICIQLYADKIIVVMAYPIK